MISPALFYNIVIGVIAALQTFETVYILQTESTVDTRLGGFLPVRPHLQAVGDRAGAAVSWILAVIIVLATVMQFRYSLSWVHYEA